MTIRPLSTSVAPAQKPADRPLDPVGPADGFTPSEAPSGTLSPKQVRDLFGGPASGGPGDYELWRVRIPAGARSAPTLGPDGSILVTTGSGVTALRPEDGSLRWDAKVANLETYAAPTTAADGRTYVVGGYQGPGLVALDGSGQRLWSVPLGSFQEPPALVPGGSILAGTYDGQVVRLDRDGQEAWRRTLDGDPPAHVNGRIAVNGQGTAFVVGDPGVLYAFDAEGNRLWKRFGEGDDAPGVRTCTGMAVTPDGDLLHVTDSNGLRCMRPDGTIRWTWDATRDKRFEDMTPEEREDPPWGNMMLGSTPALSPDGQTIYVGGDEGILYALDRDGKRKWSLDVGDAMRSHGVSVADDGTIFTSSEYEGTLHAVSPEGKVLWGFKAADGQVRAYATSRGDTAWLVTEKGDLFALNSKALKIRMERDEREQQKEVARTIELGEGTITIGGVRLPVRQG